MPSPHNFQTSYQVSYQSSSTCISQCGTSNWACWILLSWWNHFSARGETIPTPLAEKSIRNPEYLYISNFDNFLHQWFLNFAKYGVTYSKLNSKGWFVLYASLILWKDNIMFSNIASRQKIGWAMVILSFSVRKNCVFLLLLSLKI